jgi:uncharacterized membrane protein
MRVVTNPIQACNDIFMRPGSVFEALKTHNNWSWIPFFIVSILAVLPSYLYFSSVDPVWYTDYVSTNSADIRDLSPAEIETIMQFQQPEAMATYSLIGGVIGVIIINAIIAIYYNLVARSDEECVMGYTDWYGATWWMSMPIVIGSLASVLAIFVTNDAGQIELPAISATSFAFIFGVGIDSSWFNFLNTIRLETFLSIYIAACALAAWTSFTFKKCIMLAIIPTALIYGIMLLVNVM